MAVIRSKGSSLAIGTSNTYVAVAQIISLDGPDMSSETFEADTLDNNSAGIPYKPTGRTEGGKVSGELFFDPALHSGLLAILTSPTNSLACQIAFGATNNGNAAWTFAGAGFDFSPAVALKEGVKAKFAVKLDGIPTF
jgi:hypothetical protein